MVDASEAIPEERIFLVEAFEYIFRTMTPNWRELEVLASKPHLHGEERPEVMRRSDAEYDRAQLDANKWLRDRIGERSIFARICGPNGQLRLTSEGWENVGFAENGISANFVSPDDLMNPGPATEIDGVRYPVFFLRDEFEKLVQSSFGSAEPRSFILLQEKQIEDFARNRTVGARVSVETAAQPSVATQSPISVAARNQKFREWRARCGENTPSYRQDVEYMAQFDVSRDAVRELRKQYPRLPRGRPKRGGE